MNMTTEKLAELKRLAEQATPGEWLYRTDPGNPTGFTHCVKLPGEFGAWVCDCLDNADRVTDGGTAGERNAAFIAAANPQTILSLIALAERALQPEEGQALIAALYQRYGHEHWSTVNGVKQPSAYDMTRHPLVSQAIDMLRRASQLALPAGPVPVDAAHVQAARKALAELREAVEGCANALQEGEGFDEAWEKVAQAENQAHKWLLMDAGNVPARLRAIKNEQASALPAVAQPVADGKLEASIVDVATLRRSNRVSVDAGALRMVLNTLRRDAEEGRAVRGEIADELEASCAALGQPAEEGGKS